MNHDHSGGMGKHMLMMILCCAVPLLLIGAVGVFGLSLGPLQGLVPYALVLMCPLMMIFMMRGMMQGSSEDHSHHHMDAPRNQVTKQIPEVAPGGVKTAVSSRSGKMPLG